MATNAPQWKTFNLLDSASLRQVRQVTSSVQSGLDSVKEIMDTVDDILNTVQSFMQILKLIESIADRGIMAFLDSFINTVESLMDSIRSTGVYGLDLFSYHFQDFPIQYADDSFLNGNEWWKGEVASYKKIIDEKLKADAAQYQILLNVAKKINAPEMQGHIQQLEGMIKSLQQGNKPNDQDIINLKILELTVRDLPTEYYEAYNKQIRDLLELIFLWKYKPETYYEWINVICEAFVDPNDKPGKPVLSLMNKVIEEAAQGKTVEKLHHNSLPKIETLTENDFPAVFKSGRPLFSEGDYMKVVLVGFCVPSLDAVKDIWNAMQQIPDLVKGAASSSLTSFKGFKDAAEHYGKKWDDLLSKVGADFDFAQDVATYGEEPNFFGVTLDIFLRDIFRYIELLLDRMKGFNLPLTSSIFDNIDSVITTIKQWVAFAEHILNIIEQLNKLIDALLTLSQGFILNFDTNDGVPGVIEALKETKPFTTVRTNINKVLKTFELANNPEAVLSITQNASTIPEMIANVGNYKQRVSQDRRTAADQYNIADENYKAVTAKQSNLQVIYTETQSFESAKAASNYDALVAETAAEIEAQDAVIASYSDLYDAEIAATGSRSWITSQIAVFTAELASTSAFNVVNAEAQANIQAQIDALDDQNDDPYGPTIPDYAEQRAALVAQKNLLIQLKSDHDAEYTTLKDRYTETQDTITAFVTAHPVESEDDLVDYDLQISILQDYLTTSKANREIAYQAYLNAVEGYNNAIDADNANIALRQNEIASLNGQIADWTAEKTYWEAVDPIGHAARIAELEGLISDAEDDIATKNSQINGYRADILVQQANITLAEENQTLYDENAISYQELWKLMLDALIHWRQAEYYRLIKEGLNADLEEYITTQNTTINNLVASLVANTMPSQNDSTYTQTYSELNLEEGYDKTFPVASRVQNAIAKITNSGGRLEATEIPREIAQSELTYCDSILSVLTDSFINEKTNELLAQNEEEFNPNEKMFYGGFLVCFGMPTTQSFTTSATDLYALAAEKVEVTGGKVKDVKGEINTIRNDALSIFKKIFK